MIFTAALLKQKLQGLEVADKVIVSYFCQTAVS